jgi:hypothetical protein
MKLIFLILLIAECASNVLSEIDETELIRRRRLENQYMNIVSRIRSRQSMEALLKSLRPSGSSRYMPRKYKLSRFYKHHLKTRQTTA